MNPCTPGPWTVTPHYDGYHEDSSHGVFFIEEVQAEVEKWYDASLDAEPNSCEEQHALDRRDEIQDSTCRLIAAAPDLLTSLQNLVADWERVQGRPIPEDHEAKAAIKKATKP